MARITENVILGVCTAVVLARMTRREFIALVGSAQTDFAAMHGHGILILCVIDPRHQGGSA
jgi:hypothetical protein